MLISNQKPNIYEFSIIEKIYIEILPHQISLYALVYILVALFYQKHWIQASEYLLIFSEAPCTLNENKSLIAHIRMISLSFWWYAMHKPLVLISMIIQLCIWNNWYEKVSTALFFENFIIIKPILVYFMLKWIIIRSDCKWRGSFVWSVLLDRNKKT